MRVKITNSFLPCADIEKRHHSRAHTVAVNLSTKKQYYTMNYHCNSTALCILLYSDVSTYVGLYGSGLFNFGSYVTLPTLFTCFLGFDIPTSFFILLKMFLIFLYIYIYIYIYSSNQRESNHRDGPTGHKKTSNLRNHNSGCKWVSLTF